MPGWFRNASLSDDGRDLVVAYDEGGNLLESNFKSDQVMFSFFRDGTKIRDILLKQLLDKPSPDALERTESHYRWCERYGFETTGRYVVTTIEHRHFEFNPNTGEAIQGKLFGSGPQR